MTPETLELLAEIQRRIDAGEIPPEAIPKPTPAAKRRGRKPKPKPEKKANGRPVNVDARMVVLTCWVLYQDKLPKTRLRGILADALGVDDSVISKHIARVNRLASDPSYWIGRGSVEHDGQQIGLVLAMSVTELDKLKCAEERAARYGLPFDPFSQEGIRTWSMGTVQKPP